jgi:hypothetical protein
MPSKKSRRTPRAPRTDYWSRQVADPAEAVAVLNEAKARVTLASIGQNTPTELVDKFRAELDEAQAEVDKCFEKIRLTALRGDVFEQLMAEHPPTPDDDEAGLTHHDETFLPALATACSDNGWTLDDWIEEIAELSIGERNELREIVTHVNTRSWSSQIPKG